MKRWSLVGPRQNDIAIERTPALALSLHTLIPEKPKPPHSVHSPDALQLHLCYSQLPLQSHIVTLSIPNVTRVNEFAMH